MIKRIARWILRYELRRLNTQLELSVSCGTMIEVEGEYIGLLMKDGKILVPSPQDSRIIIPGLLGAGVD